MPLFDIPEKSTKQKDLELLKKSKTRQITTTKSSSGNLVNKINTIKAMVDTHLGKYKDESEVINTEERLSEYIDHCIANGVVAIDTETTGLDPLLDDIVGMSLYTPDEKTVYIPINHMSYVTLQRAKNQLDKDIISKYLKILQEANIDVIMFNAVFDIRVIKHHLGVRFKCTWDCYLASRCLNENEPHKGLKKLHQKYVLRGEEDAFKFDDLFKGVNFAYIPILTAYLYAAHDSKITYEYYVYQKQYMRLDHERKDMQNVAWVFFNIEMPCVDVVVDLEDTGVAFDFDYNQKLKEKYHAILAEKEANFHKLCGMYQEEIDKYNNNDSVAYYLNQDGISYIGQKQNSTDKLIKKVKLDDPINIQSVPQLQALLYDIAKIKPVIDKKTKKPTRSTSEETLKKLKDPLADAILEYREFSTLVSTFIDKLPECVNPNDGRIHAKFNQYGADTGRFSSQDPNLQNIPSHNKDIRKMFKATDGYVMMSADYSQQEPKAMTMMCQDPLMINAYKEGKDLYAEIAALSFNTTYENCLEFRPDGTTNPEGKERRSQAKSILLGVLYGRGVPSIAEQLGTTTAKAQEIKDAVMKGFPAIEKFEQDSINMAETLGYVTTLWGRKRRLPSMMLPDYEFEYIDNPDSLDPLDMDDATEREVPDSVMNKYLRKLKKSWGANRVKVFEEARQEGIKIVDHTKDKDYTKVVNAQIQGSAADQSKLAMIALNKDKKLKELGFRMLLPIHDEIIGECPEENAPEVVPRFKYIMEHSSGDKFTIPIKCDVEVTHEWYGERVDV